MFELFIYFLLIAMFGFAIATCFVYMLPKNKMIGYPCLILLLPLILLITPVVFLLDQVYYRLYGTHQRLFSPDRNRLVVCSFCAVHVIQYFWDAIGITDGSYRKFVDSI